MSIKVYRGIEAPIRFRESSNVQDTCRVRRTGRQRCGKHPFPDNPKLRYAIRLPADCAANYEYMMCYYYQLSRAGPPNLHARVSRDLFERATKATSDRALNNNILLLGGLLEYVYVLS